MTARTAEIKLSVALDADSLPQAIEWEASDASHAGRRECQSMLLSLWDNESKTAAAIDLWTKETTIADMNLHFYQVFHTMAETYRRATSNEEVAELIHRFGNEFARTLGVEQSDGSRGD